MSSDNPKAPYSTSKFLQQRLPACRPLFTPCVSAIFYTGMCAVSLILGLIYYFNNVDIWEKVIRYDDQCEGSVCSITFDIDKDINDKELYIYYELTKVYQVNFMYTRSKSWPQFEGEFVSNKDLSQCEPELYFEDNTLAPCGAVPRSIFNDTYSFDSNFPEITDKGIAIPSVLKLFKDANSKYTTEGQWLTDDELFEGGQRNERFVNWVQIATFPKFRKLWAKTGKKVTLKKGSYSVEIQNNFPVESFKGTKSLVIAETSFAGTKSMFLAWFFIAISIASGLIAIVVAILHFMKCFPLYYALAQGSHYAIN